MDLREPSKVEMDLREPSKVEMDRSVLVSVYNGWDFEVIV